VNESFNKILLFDGVCILCSGIVKFVIKRDSQYKFKFAALQSEAGQSLLMKYNLPTNDTDTFVLIENGKSYLRSTAGLKVLKHLGGLWSIVYVLIIVPAPIRDFIYGLIARSRYRVFGKKDQCMIPTQDAIERFLK
jgi:predicted DCC family thiol-disulfide oxidoreductase YuxK